jgi:very-short-patch-repair endonuclease
MTLPERKFYREVLKRKPFKNYRFLRQKPLANYIVDFYCPKLQLVVEIDGSQHVKNKEYDEKRTKVLESFGIQVVRYWNNEIMGNIEGVYEDLLDKLKKNGP